MDSTRASAMQYSQNRTALCRAIAASTTSSILPGTDLFRQIVAFFEAPDMFVGATSIERSRRASNVSNENGKMPLVELVSLPGNVRFWSFIER
jgi:hypothetical protein